VPSFGQGKLSSVARGHGKWWLKKVKHIKITCFHTKCSPEYNGKNRDWDVVVKTRKSEMPDEYCLKPQKGKFVS
jgi:hypothetical protein